MKPQKETWKASMIYQGISYKQDQASYSTRYHIEKYQESKKPTLTSSENKAYVFEKKK